jgi:diaminopimelate epimerase
MSGEVFFKMSGSGNDFVFLDGRWTSPDGWTPDRVRRVCDRRNGVGADGLVLLTPGSGPGKVRFLYANSDGSRGAMCGNAALCATRLSVLLELAPPDAVELETEAGVVRSRCVSGSGERATLELPDVRETRTPTVELGSGEQRIGFALVGVPHLVVLVDTIQSVDLPERGRALRLHPAVAPDGANVNFVSRTDEGGWAMRTYERGVEAETLACGTGAVACTTLLGWWGEADVPLDMRTRSGRLLSVCGRLEAGGGLTSPTLSGEGRLVFKGILGPGL